MIEITRDLFRIGERLLKVNSLYRVYFNSVRGKFEVHSCGSGRPTAMTFAFGVPYDTLDMRTIEHAMRTRRENADALEKEAEAENRRVRGAAMERVEAIERELAERLRFADRS